MKTKILKPCKGSLHNGELLPITSFVKHRNYKDGRANLCRECNNIKYNKAPKEQIVDSLKTINDKLDILICQTKLSD